MNFLSVKLFIIFLMIYVPVIGGQPLLALGK